MSVLETLWAAAEAIPARETRLEEIPWRADGCHVLGDPPTWGALADHCRQAMGTDLTYPIILGPTGDVLDGMHRLMRALVEGRETIAAVQLSEVPPPDRVRPLADEQGR